MDQRINSYRKLLAIAVVSAGATLASATTLAGGSLALVTNGNDSGSGSLRDALASGATHVMIPPSVQMIYIDTTLEYRGSEPLTILGSGQTIKTFGEIDLLTVANGADLAVSNVHFEGPGSFSIEHQGDGIGILLNVPEERQGVVQLSMSDVSVSGFAYHGVLISDCDDLSCGAGQGSGGEGSPASVAVYFDNVAITEVGTGRFDGDGLRVNERSEGGISFFASRSSFTKVGADGVELDEDDTGEGAGDVVVNVTDSIFDNNGSYCNPEILEGLLPDPAEWEEGDDDEPDLAWIATWVDGDFVSPDNACFEVSIDYEGTHVTEYEVAIDTDDGFDIDEAGPGSINTVMTDSQINGNYDEGIDFDEAGEGGYQASFIRTVAYRNTDDGFKLSEEDDGNLFASLYMVQARSNGGRGAVFEEADEGDLDVTLDRVETHKNDDNEVGIEAVQEDDDDGLLTVRNSNIKEVDEQDGIEVDGVVLDYQ